MLLLLVLVGAGLGFMILHDMDGPTISVQPDTGTIGPQRDITLVLQDPAGIRSVQVNVHRGTQVSPLFEQNFVPSTTEAKTTFSLKALNLSDGEIVLEIRAKDKSFAGFGRGNMTVVKKQLIVDTKAPQISLRGQAGSAVRRGSAAAVAFTASEELATSGVQVGDFFFSAYKQADGVYQCLYAFPVHMEVAQFVPEVVVRDIAGNETRSRLVISKVDKTLKTDTLGISDQFLESVMPAFIDQVPGIESHLDRYIKVNSELRVQNEQFLYELGNKTEPVKLWEGTFLRLPGSATRALFADQRIYKYGETVIDKQTHMGVDLASTVHAPVPAANAGKVVFAGDLGIFGKLVVIDHGLGLMSLYSHLSGFQTTVGEKVTRGQIIANTGRTGLAAGDHLHFGVLVNGLQIQPLDWFDKNWEKTLISDRLR